jgi:hypothetical protein
VFFQAKEHLIVNLRDIIDRIKLLTGLNQKEIATQIYTISPNNLSNKVRRNTIDIDIIGEWAEHRGVSFDWLLSGVGEPYINRSVTQKRDSGTADSGERGGSFIDDNDIEHAELVKHFLDKKLAKEISQHLLVIERINQTAFKETCAYIRGIEAGLKSMVEYDRRKCDRRKHKDENLPPDQERRIADRRKAVGQ